MTATQAQRLPIKLGPYDVGAKIAGGGMATVYIGRKTDDDGVEQLVALKVIKDELAHDTRFVHMFLDEAKILSRLSHPNIIGTLEYGVTDDHRFIAMELLLGRTLTDVWELLAAKGERVPVALGVWICARVAEGLEHAHTLTDDDGQQLHVIHRDVNPSNIFLTFDGRVKLIDFGLAKAKNRLHKTGEGIVKGKVPYLSPEQILQDHVDGRSDLYSLGTTLWELGTGKRLFKRETDIATIEAIRDAVVPDPREIVKGYPDALWPVLLRSLAPKPDERFASAGEMARALDAFLKEAGEVVGGETLEQHLAAIFAGDLERQTAWLRQAKTRAVRPKTMPPPVPLPEVKLGATEKRPVSKPPPKKAPAEAKAGEKKPEETRPASKRAPQKPPNSSRPKAISTPETTVEPPEAVADRRFWMYAAAAFVAILVLIAATMR